MTPPLIVMPSASQVLSDVTTAGGATDVAKPAGQVGHTPGTVVTELTALDIVLSRSQLHLVMTVMAVV